MSSYPEAQARLAGAKRRRELHAATVESKRLMTQQLRREVEQRRGRVGLLQRWRGIGL
jgi:hypothetical protein